MESGITAMLSILKRTVNAVIAASLFVVTAFVGVIAGIFGVFVRAQVPEQNGTDAAPQDASSKALASPMSGSRVSHIPSKGTR